MKAYEIINIIASRPDSFQKFNLVALSDNCDFKPNDTLKLGDELGLESVVLNDEQAEEFGLWLTLNKTAKIVYVPGIFSSETMRTILNMFTENKKEITIIYNHQKDRQAAYWDNKRDLLFMALFNRSVSVENHDS